MFGKNKVFTLTAIMALALGIGANAAIFSVVNAVLLKPEPFPDSDRLVMFMNTTPDGPVMRMSPAKFQHLRSQSTIQDATAVLYGVVNFTGKEVAEQIQYAQVSADYFKLMGAPIIRGRGFSREEDLPNGGKLALISYKLWTQRFASDPNVLGTTISLSGEPHTIIGVVGPSFDLREFGPVPEVWTPFQLDPNTTDQGHYFNAMGRLRPGVTLEQAKAEVQKSAADFKRKFFPEALGDGNGFTVEPMEEAFTQNVRQSLLVLLGAVTFVLLIACANVANLLLLRATSRKREIAIRASLGAGRRRIVRQLLTESVLLSLAGGALGIVLGFIGIRALLSVNTAGLPRVGENGSIVGIDWPVILFTLIVSAGTGILFGLIPALQGSRSDLNASLKDGGERSGGGLRHNKFRSLLAVVEVALAVILLIGSALFIRAQVALNSVDPGFDTKNVLTMQTSLTGPRFLQSAGVERIVRDGVDHLRSLPGVISVAATCCMPLQNSYSLPFRILGRPLVNGPFHGGGPWSIISPGYFDAFKIPIKRGRAFTDHDDASSQPVAIINETMARQYWVKGDDPLNSRIVIGKGVMKEFNDEPERQIIGIVGDVRDGLLYQDPQAHTYVPQAQIPDAVNAWSVQIYPIAWVVRAQVAPDSLMREVQQQLRQVTGVPVSGIRSMGDVLEQSTSRQRFNMLLMTVFACTALLLAAIGIYGLMAYSVEQRTAEIGIRLALGAEVNRVRKMIVVQGMCLAIVGVIIGVSFAFSLTRFISSFLFSIKPWDPVAFIAVPIVLGAVALLAVWFPARRASRVHPVDALRYQ